MATPANSAASPAEPARTGFARVFAWPRLRFTLAVSVCLGLFVGLQTNPPFHVDAMRGCTMGLWILFAFGVLETRPKRLPKWMPRTVLRIVGVVLAVPVSAMFMAGAYLDKRGLGALVGAGLLFAPWIAIGAIFRARENQSREQAFSFELERSEFERRESDARLRQLQAQVEPHFLFNTLANVQALVESGSPQASKVLSSLIAYLRAAVPRMHSRISTLSAEIDQVRAYLEIMQLRMPDRLQYTIRLEPAVAGQPCPPVMLLTLVENAVKHGIDPSETGGRIEVDVWRRDSRCVIRVTDTGMGLRAAGHGLGTGLTTLRERLKLAYGGEAKFHLTDIMPHGACAEIVFPIREAAA